MIPVLKIAINIIRKIKAIFLSIIMNKILNIFLMQHHIYYEEINNKRLYFNHKLNGRIINSLKHLC